MVGVGFKNFLLLFSSKAKWSNQHLFLSIPSITSSKNVDTREPHPCSSHGAAFIEAWINHPTGQTWNTTMGVRQQCLERGLQSTTGTALSNPRQAIYLETSGNANVYCRLLKVQQPHDNTAHLGVREMQAIFMKVVTKKEWEKNGT